MTIFYISRMTNVVFVFLPLAIKDKTGLIWYFYLFGAVNLVASWYSSHIITELIGKYQFASNLQEIAYSLGLGRSSIVFISMVSA